MIDPIMNMLREGGWALVAIAATSLIAWTLIFREWLRLHERTLGGWRRIERAVEALRQTGAIDSPATAHDDGENIVARLLQSDLVRRRLDRRAFEAQILPMLNSEAAMFQRTQRMVTVLAACMPLLGLLGTVLGMIQTFGALTDRGVADVNALAGGISQALITTQAGLVIAVPVLLMNGYLAARIRRYLDTASVMVKKIETAVCYDS